MPNHTIESLYWIVSSQNYPPCYFENCTEVSFPNFTRTGSRVIAGNGDAVLIAPGSLRRLIDSLIPDGEMELYGLCCYADEAAILDFQHFYSNSLPPDVIERLGFRLYSGSTIEEIWILLDGWYRIDSNKAFRKVGEHYNYDAQ